MDNWFTVDEIDGSTFAISEYGHWEEPHSYLVLGKKQAALIDTGLGVYDINSVVKKLTALPVKVVITHAHWDHIGGADSFDDVYVHKLDADWMEKGLPISDKNIQDTFMKESPSLPLPSDFDIASYATPKIRPAGVLKHGDSIELGERTLNILHTPGHSPGSICIYDKERGYLFTGDTLYEGTLYMNYESTNPTLFGKSINRLARIKGVRYVLPGHHKLPLTPSFIQFADDTFQKLAHDGELVHGSGLHKFEKLEILA